MPQRFGRYRVVGEIGQGAMGIVYRAEDPELGRTVAVKTIALSGGSQEQDVQQARFRQEARAAGTVSHPAIVTIYDVGREGDLAFIAMEYVEGRELKQMIREGSLTPTLAVEIAALVADGLAFAHARGVIHRDIKPGNIMVLPDGRVKIMDFGIARLQESSDVKTQSGVLLGSPQYMAPEQVAGQQIDGRADLFSLGVVLYEMLTGVKPFDAADLTQLLFWVVNLPHKPPSERNASLPPVIDYIVARALKKSADERYATAADFARDLRQCIPELESAIAAAKTRGDTRPERTTVPMAAIGETTRSRPPDRLELRASPRFDSGEALARLPVMSDTGTGTRTLWKAGTSTLKRRVDRSRALLWGAYGTAFLIAIAIVLA